MVSVDDNVLYRVLGEVTASDYDLTVVITTVSKRNSIFLKTTLHTIYHGFSGRDIYVQIIILVEGDKKHYFELLKFIKDRLNNGIGSTNIRVDIIYYKEGFGLSFARNLGVKIAKAPFIYFIDDDAIISSKWIEEMYKMKNMLSRIPSLTGPSLPLFVSKPLLNMPKFLYSLVGCTSSLFPKNLGVTYIVIGSNMGFSKSIFDFAGFFNPMLGFKHLQKGILKFLGGEEVEFCFRAKKILKRKFFVIYDPKLTVFHIIPPHITSVWYLVKRAFHMGLSDRLIHSTYSDIQSMLASKGNKIAKELLDSLKKKRLNDIVLSILLLSIYIIGHSISILVQNNLRRYIKESARER